MFPRMVDLSRHSHHLRESDGAVPIAWLLVSDGGLIAGGIGVRQGRQTCFTAVDPMEVSMLTLRYEPNEPRQFCKITLRTDAQRNFLV